MPFVLMLFFLLTTDCGQLTSVSTDYEIALVLGWLLYIAALEALNCEANLLKTNKPLLSQQDTNIY